MLPPSDPVHLFVYGTLRAGGRTRWSLHWGTVSSFVGTGRSRGFLFELDGYPGMTVPAGMDAWVKGEVYRLHDAPSLWPVLDAYEGHEFERQILSVLLDNGRALNAWAYVYCLDTEGKPRINSGDFLSPE
jgi:gamma-glutamylcyclotransferase (GGCT)/AIG2-like uncharacterized protein YtfP